MRVLLLPACRMDWIGGVQQFVLQLHSEFARRGDTDWELQLPPSELHRQWLDVGSGTPGTGHQDAWLRYLKDQAIDIIHTQAVAGAHLLAFDDWAFRAGVRHVSTIHDVPAYGIDRRALSRLKHTRVATQSRHNQAQLEELTQAEVALLPVGISFSEFQFTGFTDKSCVALPARIAATKGADRAVRLLNRVGDTTGKRMRLLLSDLRRPSFGSEDTFVLRLLATIEDARHVQVEFAHDDSGVSEMYAEAAATLCLPTVQEGFGLTALESLACGRPVIARMTGGMNEWLEGLPGVIRVETDSDVCRAIETVLSAPEQWQKQALLARERLVSRYDIGPVLDQHKQCYETLSRAA